MKNVLIVIDSLGLGGAENLVFSSLKYCDRNRFNYCVATVTKNPKKNLIREIQDIGFSVMDIGSKFNIIEIILILFKLVKIILKNKIEIVHSHLFYANIISRFAVLFARVLFFRKIRMITTLHNPDYSSEYNSSMKFKIRKIIDVLSGKIINNRFIAVSSYVKRDFENECGFLNISVVYNGIDLEKYLFEEKRNNELQKILFVGRFEDRKGVWELIHAYNFLKKKFPGISLEFAGDGVLKEEIENFVIEQGLKDVKFHGYIKTIQDYLKKGDLLIVPSHYEGFGIVIIEAMAAGIPVMATNVTAIPEIIQHGQNGLLIQPKSSEEIVSMVSKIKEHNAEKIKNIIERARNDVIERFDIQKQVKKIEKLYEL